MNRQIFWDVEGEPISLETGKIARQAHGSVVVRHEETWLLATVVSKEEAGPYLGYFPMSVEYREKASAGGKIPGGFQRREGKISDEEILKSRLVDRSLRSLFPEGFLCETQVLIQVFSAGKKSDLESLAILGASAALHLSPIPWNGPVGGLRIIQRKGKYKVFPTWEERQEADLDIVLSCGPKGLIMLEGKANEVEEKDLVQAIEYGEKIISPFLEKLNLWQKEEGKTKRLLPEKEDFSPLLQAIEEKYGKKIQECLSISAKQDRYKSFHKLKKEVLLDLGSLRENKDGALESALQKVKYRLSRSMILEENKRVDGRSPEEIRPLEMEVGLFPANHGSALFTRGETQALVSCTLGTPKESQVVESLFAEALRSFLLHYNFPPYSVGEVRPQKEPARREIGHGDLARRALLPLVPSLENFPYTVRIVSDISESNGSSSMATVCGASLALMDAGVPIKAPVAGIAMGLIHEKNKTVILYDILGDEDHIGDMDFKVAGTRKGITSLQMDNKIESIPRSILEKALEEARKGRIYILEKMGSVIEKPKALSPKVGQSLSFDLDPQELRGKNMRGKIFNIQKNTQTVVDLENTTLRIYGKSISSIEKAFQQIQELLDEKKKDH